MDVFLRSESCDRMELFFCIYKAEEEVNKCLYKNIAFINITARVQYTGAFGREYKHLEFP